MLLFDPVKRHNITIVCLEANGDEQSDDQSLLCTI